MYREVGIFHRHGDIRNLCLKGRRKAGMQAAADEMVRSQHWLSEHEFEQILGGNGGQGSLACHGPWSHKESDMTR